MAGTSLLALIDDIATLLDDISVYSKLAAKKTAGVLGDDLALNAEQVTGIKADRELPVVWAVARGAFLNKLILVPLALFISAFLPWLVILLLMLGGAYLCYEGFEKVFEKLFHAEQSQQQQQKQKDAIINTSVTMLEYERDKIKGAIRTDFILSAEIIVLTLGTVKDADFMIQVAVLSAIAIAVTIVVYGLVAGIVKLDDAGLYLLRTDVSNKFSPLKIATGRVILKLAPYLMKLLSVIGTLAMFLVGGGIFLHNVPVLHHAIDSLSISVFQIPAINSLFVNLTEISLNLILGVVIGASSVLLMNIISRFAKLKA